MAKNKRDERTMKKSLTIVFEDLGERFAIDIDERLNPGLWLDFAQALPFRTVASHSVVSGLDITFWTPVYSLAAIKTLERIDRMPIGRVFLSGSGNKLLIKYGPQTEWVDAPPIGMIRSEDLGRLEAVGEEIWNSIFISKHIHPVTMDVG